MNTNHFKFKSATLVYEGNRKCSQFFTFTGDTTLSAVVKRILTECAKVIYKNVLKINANYGGVEMVVSIDFDNNTEVYVLTHKDVRLPLTEKTDMLVNAGMRTYVCRMNQDGEFEFNEYAEEVKDDTRSYNVGASDYAQHSIQPWDIWREYKLNPWDADIVKRVLRTKETDGRKLDYEKIIHICKERIRQIETYGE